MFSYEQRIIAVRFYMKYESWTRVINELGYPSVGALREWVNKYNTKGELVEKPTRSRKYSDVQINYAVNYYVEHGRYMSKTLRDLGYPNKTYLKQWLIERVSDFHYTCRTSNSMIQLPQQEKKQTTIELCAREEKANNIANKYGVSRTSLYNWKNSLLGDKEVAPMPKKKKLEIVELQDEISSLTTQAEELRRHVYQLQLEKDVLEKAAEVIKKDQGISM